MNKNKLEVLDTINIDRSLSIPLYKQLYNGLKNIIEKELLEPNEPFFSESNLLKYFSVSRITVRQALQLLENEGLIIKSQGNKTIVAEYPGFSWDFHDLTDDLYELGDNLTTKLLSVDKVESNEEINKNLQIDLNNKYVYKIERLRIVNNVKIAYSISYLIPTLDLDIKKTKEIDNLAIRELLKTQGENPYYSSEVIKTANADEISSKHLELPLGYAVFFRKRITYDDKHKPLEYVESYYNSKVTSYYIHKKVLFNPEELRGDEKIDR